MNISNLIDGMKSKNITLYCENDNLKLFGPQNMITNQLKKILKQNKTEIIQYLKRESIVGIEKTADDCYPLSGAQKRMYVLNSVNQDGLSYNVPIALKIEGNLDQKRVESAIRKLIIRHESLRTVFVEKNGDVFQKIKEDLPFDLECIEIKETQIRDEIRRFIQPFDLKRGPLMRICLYQVEEEKYYIVLDMHHIITDGTSMNVFINDFCKIYNNRNLETLNIQYKDFSSWQNHLFEAENIKEEEYWLNMYQGEIPVLNIPIDFIRPKIKSYEGENIDFTIDKTTTERLKGIARKYDVTMYMLLLAVYKTFLSKYTNQQDIIVGVPAEGRSGGSLQNIIGIFVNTLPVRSQPQKELKFDEYLKNIKKIMLGAYENQNYQLDQLIEKLNIGIDPSRGPLFQTMFDYQNLNEFQFQIDGLKFSNYDLEVKTAKFDLSLTVVDDNETFHVNFEYCTKLFCKETIRAMGSKLLAVVDQICANAQIAIKDIQLLSTEEEQKIRYEFNRSYTEIKNNTLHNLIEKSVERNPERTAFLFEEKRVTYDELNKRANKLAWYLRSLGVGVNDIVGLLTERSIEMMVGIIAILKAGAAYLPIDVDFPDERISIIVKDSRMKLILTQDNLAQKLEKCPYITFDDQKIQEYESENPEMNRAADSLAYVIYTSGTTGAPKGVKVCHQNIVQYVDSFLNQIPLTGDDRILQVVSYTFDAFCEEVFPALVVGASIVISRKLEETGLDGMMENIEKHRITMISCSPLLLNEIDKKMTFRRSMKFISGGDVLKYEYIKNIITYCDVYNSYGPTETTVCATYYKVSKSDANKISIPIGKPMKNYHVSILDEEEQLLPIGMVGEIGISGGGLSKGYLFQQELTNQKFREHKSLGRIYYTGDLGRWLSDGNIEYIGRTDQQVKIRGYRIELQEIEYKLLNQKGISDVVTIVKKDGYGSNYICAYICGENLKIKDIRTKLSQELPLYMIPEQLIPLHQIPRTINGKVDKRALPDIDLSEAELDEEDQPANEVEKRLTELWKKVLKVKQLGTNTNFFEAGGHSLKALSLISEIHQEFGTDIPFGHLLAAGTIRETAKLITKGKRKEHFSIERAEKKEFYPVTSAQKRLYLLQSLDKANVSYNVPFALKLTGERNIERVREAFKKVIKRHESLRTSFVMQDGEVMQKVHETAKLDFLICEERNDDKISEAIHMFIQSFDLEQAPLMRVRALRIKEESYLVLVDVHHIVCDGLSMDILLNDFFECYSNEAQEPLKIQYKDYTQWKRKFEGGQEYEAQEKYWLKLFDGEIPILKMPTDFPREKKQNFEGDTVILTLSGARSKQLSDFANEKKVTMNMLLTTVYSILLHKYTNQNDIVIGAPIVGRNHSDLRNVIGMFVNTLPVRYYPEGDKKFIDYLAEVKECSMKAYENQDYDLYDLIEKLKLNRHTNRNPLFDTTFNSSEHENINFAIDEVTFESYSLPFYVSKFDFSLSAVQTADRIHFILRYCTKLYRKSTMKRLLLQFEYLLEQMIEDSRMTLDQMQIVTEDEKKKLLHEFHNTRAEFPVEKTINELFEEQAQRSPKHPAIIFQKKVMTYQELNERANCLAAALKRQGAGAATVVAIMVERSMEMIVGILAILKAGAAYLPLEPVTIQERGQYILANSKAILLLGQQEYIKKYEAIIKTVYIDQDELYEGDGKNIRNTDAGESLAYVIYTSGTTGRSKGVMIKHSSIVNYCCSVVKKTQITDRDSTALLSSYAFDLGHTAVFTSLITGCALHILPEEISLNPSVLIPYLAEHISYIKITPSLFRILVESDKAKELTKGALRLIVLGGEAIDAMNILQFKKMDEENRVTILNHYGPTETAVGCVCGEVERKWLQQNINMIGKPIHNTKVYILDERGRLCPIGVPGELCVSGAGIAKGYRENEPLTSEKFVDCPFEPGTKLYKTGDLAKWHEDGNIEFLGRKDDQVKIRGYRIEIGEILFYLRDHPMILDAAVTALGDRNKYLCAYLVPKGQEEISILEIRDYLLKKIPDYMVPSYFIKMDQLPLTVNGKLDKKSLPDPKESWDAHIQYERPRNDLEEIMVSIWKEVLGLKDLGIDTNFFEAGGDSIKALQIVSRLAKENYKLEIKDIYDNLNIKKISQCLVYQNGIQKNGEVVEGYVELTPIQLKFLEQNNGIKNHYNQSFILDLKQDVEEQQVRNIFQVLTLYHDAFRMVYTSEDGAIIQYNRGADAGCFDLTVMDFTDGEHLEIERHEVFTSIQKKISLEEGKLLQLCLFKTKDGMHLLIVISHMVVDGVSWRILFEHLQILFHQLHHQKPLNLGYKLSSFKDYALQLKAYGTSEAIQNEMAYWQRISAARWSYLSKESQLWKGNHAGCRTHSIVFDQIETTKLMHHTNHAYHTQINDILLTALAVTTRMLTGDDKIKIMLEGHGREDILKGVDLTGMVGWLTTTYPVLFDLGGEYEIAANIKAIKEILRKIPNKGIGYGILRYLTDTPNLKQVQETEIIFNYLGELDTGMNEKIFSISHMESGQTIGYEIIRNAPLEFSAVSVEGTLIVSVSYDRELYTEERIENINRTYKENLLTIINHCAAKKQGEKTASDYGYGDISSEDLESILGDFEV